MSICAYFRLNQYRMTVCSAVYSWVADQKQVQQWREAERRGKEWGKMVGRADGWGPGQRASMLPARTGNSSNPISCICITTLPYTDVRLLRPDDYDLTCIRG